MSEVADAIVAVTGSLGVSHMRSLADAYRGAGAYSPTFLTLSRNAVPAPHHGTVDRLNAAWKGQAHLTGESIALAIDSVLAAQQAANVPTVEVVVTGPDSPAAPVRLTSEVVRQLINQSTQRLLLLSYAAYRMGSVIEALDVAVARGVNVDLVLESADNLDGGGGAHAYAKYTVYEWPLDSREPRDAKLHAKAVVVDGRDALLTSANMTNAAYDKNIELGVLCRGGGVALQVQRHFDALIARGVLRRVS